MKSGRIKLANGNDFFWTLNAAKTDLFGSVVLADGRMAEGLSGWYHTSNPQWAAAYAERELSGKQGLYSEV